MEEFWEKTSQKSKIAGLKDNGGHMNPIISMPLSLPKEPISLTKKCN